MKTEHFLQRFSLLRDLGKGSYGKVKLAEDISTSQLVALKFIARESLKTRSQVVRVNREIRILKMLDHPNIIRLYDAVETETDIILVMEYVPGGELFQYIQSKANGLSEAESKGLFCKILSAVEYCHANKIIHRDLKPENLLMDANGNVKLIDFGFANVFDPESFCSTFCGSPFYAAPEVIEGRRYSGPPADCWSLGIILYILVAGRVPFAETEMKSLIARIKALDYSFPYWVSKEAKHLIRSLLTIEPSKRITIEQVKNHVWLKESLKWYYIHANDVVPPRRQVEQIDKMLLTKLERYAFFPKETLVTRIVSDQNSPQFACYHLLKERFNRELRNAGNSTATAAAYNPFAYEVPNAMLPLEQRPFAIGMQNNPTKVAPFAGAIVQKRSPTGSAAVQIPRAPDLEIYMKSDVFVQEMISFLSKLPNITSLVMDANEKYKWSCMALGVYFTVKVAFSEGNWFSAAHSHATVYIDRIEGDLLGFLQLKQTIIKHFI